MVGQFWKASTKGVLDNNEELGMTRKILLFVLTAFLTAPGALAQTGGSNTDSLPIQARPTADAALQDARAAADRARASGERPYPDAPNWAEAIRLGREALQAAPGDPSVLRFLAETYSATNWYAPAWQTWRDLATSVGTLDSAALKAGSAAGNQLAYLRYDNGDRAGALELYQEVIDFNPNDPQAYTWAGRILLEQGQAEASLPYWQEAVRLAPEDEGNRYFLELAQDDVRYGAQGTENFYAGIAAYEAGNKAEALQHFQDAAQDNANYKQAFVWAGRTALELNQPELATGYWQRALTLDPSDEGASYFLKLSQDEARWGMTAATAFYDGVRLYENGDAEGAKTQFLTATQSNPDYAEAWAWLGRTQFETNNFVLAAQAYGQASELEPNNETYSYFYAEATRRASQ